MSSGEVEVGKLIWPSSQVIVSLLRCRPGWKEADRRLQFRITDEHERETQRWSEIIYHSI